MPIEITSTKLLDQCPEQETWSLDENREWKCFRGPRFSTSLFICDGKLEDICDELQTLREHCERKPYTSGFHVCWQPRDLLGEPETPQQRKDGTVRFALRFVITNGEKVLGESYRE